MEIFRLQKETTKTQVAQKVTERVLPDLDLAVQDDQAADHRKGAVLLR